MIRSPRARAMRATASRSVRGNTRPVGFDGVTRMMALVAGPIRDSRVSGRNRQPAASSSRQKRGRPPHRRICCRCEAKPGSVTITSSPGSTSRCRSRLTPCMLPAVIRIRWSGSTSMPVSARSRRRTASRNAGRPSGSAYLPISGSDASAAATAERMAAGVRNDGSPQASEAAPSTRALRIAISLIADSSMPVTRCASARGGTAARGRGEWMRFGFMPDPALRRPRRRGPCYNYGRCRQAAC